jgi:murein DD-endopeptidase MepM/ murein hydrolase activator NlpD
MMGSRFGTAQLASVLLVGLLSGCAALHARQMPASPVAAGTATASATAVPASTPTPTLAPFRIDLPGKSEPPISGWRPPLYPVPWAVSAFDHFYFARPIGADQINWPLATYRYGGVFFANVVHTGVDIDAPYGTPILAAGPGTVVWADWGLFWLSPGLITDPYGQAVVLRMDFGRQNKPLYSVYAHMSKIIALPGQHVETGDILGLVGDTGATTGPHVHFEVRWGRNSFQSTYNPELWMAPPEGRGVLAGRITDTRNTTLDELDVVVRNTVTGQGHSVRTYGGEPANPDPYYNENLVMGDLPAGLYKVTFDYKDKEQQEWMYVYPGQVTYFAFHGADGFTLGLPSSPEPDLGQPTVVP